MQRDVKVGSISWINDSPNPIWFSGKAAVLDPDWVPKTYMGLAATANTPPPEKPCRFRQIPERWRFPRPYVLSPQARH